MKLFIHIFLISFLPLFGSDVVSSKKAITITNSLTLKQAQDIAKSLPSFNIYIYKTTTTKVPYFVLYAVNIEKSKMYQSLKIIKRKFKDAYPSSDKRIKSLSLNNSSNNLFVKATQTINNTHSNQTKKYANSKEKYIYGYKVAKQKAIRKEKKDIWVNPIKDAITLFSAKNLEEAKKIAEEYKYNDIYIHNRNFFYSLYIVNLKANELKPLLKYVHETIPTARKTSKARIKYYAKNKSTKNLFIPSTKRPEIKVLRIVKKGTINKKSSKKHKKLLIQAEQTFAKNDFKKTIELLTLFLKNNLANHINGNFLLGRAYYLSKQYEKALATFEKILILDDNLQRVRLELAQTYLSLKMNKEALIELNTVLSSNIPENVKTSIEKRIAFIKSQEKKHSFNFRLALNYIYNNNINDTTSIDSYDIYVPTFNTNLTLFSDQKQSDYSKLYQFNINHNYKIKDTTILESSFNISSQNYNKFRTKNTKDLTLSTYLSKYSNKNKLSYGIDLTKNYLDGSKNQSTVGFGGLYQTKLSKNSSNIVNFKIFKKYYDKQTDIDKESNNIQILLGHSRKTNNIGTINAMCQVSQQKALQGKRTDVSQKNYGLTLVNNYKWDNFISSTIMLSSTKNKYDLKDINFLTRREDTVHLSSASMNFHFNKNLTSSLNVSYTKSSSNHEPFDYDKTMVKTGIVYTF